MDNRDGAAPPSYAAATAPAYPPGPGVYNAPAPVYSQPIQAGYPPPQQPHNYNAGYDGVPQNVPKNDDVEAGNNMAVAFAGSSFSDKAIRRAFIRKVYLILSVQLLFTCGIICLFQFVGSVKTFVKSNPAIYYVSYGTFLVTYIVLVCCKSVRRKFPGNFIALAIFTAALSYMTGTIASFYDVNSVLIAAGITAAVCVAISIFAIQTKWDFTLCSGFLLVFSLVLFLFGISCIIVWRTSVDFQTKFILQCVYGALAALLFGMFLVYDTQMVMGGRKYELSPEEYIYGALQLYLDVVYLFIIILSFFGGSKN